MSRRAFGQRTVEQDAGANVTASSRDRFGIDHAALRDAEGLSSVDATAAVPINDLAQRQKHRRLLVRVVNPRIDLPKIFALYLAGRLPLDELIGDRRPLAEVNRAYAKLRRGGAGRMILLP